MSEVVLVDGTFELFRAYYGAPPRTTAGGVELGAAIGVVRSVQKLVRERRLEFVALAFDSVVESFRNDLYAGYKTGDGMDPVLYAQFPIVEELSNALGFKVYGMREFEADDALATAASRLELEPSVTRVVIASPDKDLCQCVVRERVVTWDRIRERTFDESGVMERLGVPPASVPDYLALVGDSADGFPGVPRWGEKSARALLARYAHLEHIPDSADDWDVSVRGARALAESLARHRKDAELFRVLATLRRDVPLDASLEAIRWRAPERNELESVLGRYGASGDELQGLAALLLG